MNYIAVCSIDNHGLKIPISREKLDELNQFINDRPEISKFLAKDEILPGSYTDKELEILGSNFPDLRFLIISGKESTTLSFFFYLEKETRTARSYVPLSRHLLQLTSDVDEGNGDPDEISEKLRNERDKTVINFIANNGMTDISGLFKLSLGEFEDVGREIPEEIEINYAPKRSIKDTLMTYRLLYSYFGITDILNMIAEYDN